MKVVPAAQTPFLLQTIFIGWVAGMPFAELTTEVGDVPKKHATQPSSLQTHLNSTGADRSPGTGRTSVGEVES